MTSRSKLTTFLPVVEKVAKGGRKKAKLVDRLEIDVVNNAALPAANRSLGTPVDTEVLVEAAKASLLRELQGEKSGRLAFQLLKEVGALNKIITEPQDVRTEEEKQIDRKAKILYGLMKIALLRAEDFNSPFDLTDEESVRNHEIKLVPVGEEQGEGDKPRPISRKVPDAASPDGPAEPSPTVPSGPPGEEPEDEENS